MRARDLAPQLVVDLAGACLLFGSFSARSTFQDRSPYCAELLKWLFGVYNTRGFATIMFAPYFAAHQSTFAPFDKHLASLPSYTFDSFIRCQLYDFYFFTLWFLILFSFKNRIHRAIPRANIQLQSPTIRDPFTHYSTQFFSPLNFKHFF